MANRKLPGDRRYARDFIDADFFIGEAFIIYFQNGLHLQTLTFFLYFAHLGETLNISTANDFIFTAIFFTVCKYFSTPLMLNVNAYVYVYVNEVAGSIKNVLYFSYPNENKNIVCK